MRRLGGAVKGELLIALVVFGDRRARLHRMRDDALVDEIEPHAVRGPLEGRVGRLLVAEIPVEAEIVGAASWICGVPSRCAVSVTAAASRAW